MLKAGQEYSVKLEMEIPDIVNAYSSNFMVVSRFGHGPKTLATTTRPGLIAQRSALVETAYKMVRLPLYLTNLLEERRCVCMNILDSLVESSSNPLTNFALELKAGQPSSQVPKTFAVRLVLIAKLSRLQSFLWTWKSPVFVLFVLFGASSLTLVVVAYLLYRQVLLKTKENVHEGVVKEPEESSQSENIERELPVVYSDSDFESEHLVPLL